MLTQFSIPLIPSGVNGTQHRGTADNYPNKHALRCSVSESMWSDWLDDHHERSNLPSPITEALDADGYQAHTNTNGGDVVDAIAQTDGHEYTVLNAHPHMRPYEVIFAAEHATTTDGLIIVGPSRDELERCYNLLRSPYQEPVPDGVIPYKSPNPLVGPDDAYPVLPSDTAYAWTLTSDDTLDLSVDDTVVASTTGTEPNPTIELALATLHDLDDHVIVQDADGEVIEAAPDTDSLPTDWSPIHAPARPRAGEYLSVLDHVRLLSRDGAELTAFDPTPAWLEGLSSDPTDPAVLQAAAATFTERYLVEDGSVSYNEVRDAFAQWLAAETGQPAPSLHMMGRFLPDTKRRLVEGRITTYLPDRQWRVPRRTDHSSDADDSAVMAR